MMIALYKKGWRLRRITITVYESNILIETTPDELEEHFKVIIASYEVFIPNVKEVRFMAQNSLYRREPAIPSFILRDDSPSR